MKKETLNICQVSLSGNIPIILENYKNFSNLYTDINFYIICPKSQVYFFKKKLNHINIYIISEDQIITFSNFKKISNNYSLREIVNILGVIKAYDAKSKGLKKDKYYDSELLQFISEIKT